MQSIINEKKGVQEELEIRQSESSGAPDDCSTGQVESFVEEEETKEEDFDPTQVVIPKIFNNSSTTTAKTSSAFTFAGQANQGSSRNKKRSFRITQDSSDGCTNNDGTEFGCTEFGDSGMH